MQQANDVAYKKLLRKMLFIEEVGKLFYKAIGTKTINKALQESYHYLYLNEENAKTHIQEEITRLKINRNPWIETLLLHCINFIFYIMPVFVLLWGRDKILNQKPYQKWAAVYINRNKELWSVLVKHEQEQIRIIGMEGKYAKNI